MLTVKLQKKELSLQDLDDEAYFVKLILRYATFSTFGLMIIKINYAIH